MPRLIPRLNLTTRVIRSTSHLTFWTTFGRVEKASGNTGIKNPRIPPNNKEPAKLLQTPYSLNMQFVAKGPHQLILTVVARMRGPQSWIQSCTISPIMVDGTIPSTAPGMMGVVNDVPSATARNNAVVADVVVGMRDRNRASMKPESRGLCVRFRWARVINRLP